MKIQLIKIGNSRGVRIPKTMLEQCRLNGDLNIELRENEIVISSEHNQRSGWDEAFKKARSLKENSMIDDDGINLSGWDEKEWKW